MNLTFKDMEASPALRESIEQRATKLTERFGPFSRIDVVISQPHKHSHKGQQFECHAEVHIPRREPICAGEGHGDEDAYHAVRATFDALERQLEHAKAHPRHH